MMDSDAALIADAVAALRRGELVGMPTETVYGLAGDAANPEAIQRIFVLKGRPADHPLIVHLLDATDLAVWAETVPPAAAMLAAAFWPGPLTLILRRAAGVSDLLTGGQDTVGLRVPRHPVARALLRQFQGALAAPSANRFGRISPTRAAHVRAEFGDALPIVLDGGNSEIGLESTIVDLSSGIARVLRPGVIAVAQLEAVLGTPVHGAAPVPSAQPRVSGALDSHYAPRSPARLLERAQIALQTDALALVLVRGCLPAGQRGLSLPEDAVGYGQQLYAALRTLDAQAPSEILIETVPDDAAWWAVRDRLTRATWASRH